MRSRSSRLGIAELSALALKTSIGKPILDISFHTTNNMSTAAKATLATTVLSAVCIVTFVHYQQKADQAVRCHQRAYHADL